MGVLSKKLKENPCTCELCKEGVFSNEKSYECKLIRAIRVLLDKFEEKDLDKLDEGYLIHFSNIEMQKTWFFRLTHLIQEMADGEYEDVFSSNIENPNSLYITYYKSRGRTEQMYFLYDGVEPPTLPTVKQLEFLLVILDKIFEIDKKNYLDSKIEAAKDTWKDVDVDEYMKEVRGEE